MNNAGIRSRKAFGNFTREDFAAMMEVNLAAAFFASQAVLPAMRTQGGGRIIHVASQHGSVASEENAAVRHDQGGADPSGPQYGV